MTTSSSHTALSVKSSSTSPEAAEGGVKVLVPTKCRCALHIWVYLYIRVEGVIWLLLKNALKYLASLVDLE
jgi:hypothetical protein